MTLITSLYASNGGKPKFEEFMTPIGRVVHSYHDRPQAEEDDKTKQPIIDPKTGAPKANYKVTLAWPKAELNAGLLPMRQLAMSVMHQAWGPQCDSDQWFRLEPFLRDGDNPEHNTKRKDYLIGMYYLNFKGKANPIMRDGRHTGAYDGAPQLIGPYNEDIMPADFYAGCEARISGIMFGTEYMGRRFISTRLNNVQKYKDGERLGGNARPDAKSQFDPLMQGSAGGTLGGGGLGSLGGVL